jgi:hypothetical protein
MQSGFLPLEINDSNASINCTIVSSQSLLASLHGLTDLMEARCRLSALPQNVLFLYEIQYIFQENHHFMLLLLANSCEEQQFCSCKDTRPCNYAIAPSVHTSRTRHQIRDSVHRYINQCKTGHRSDANGSAPST